MTASQFVGEYEHSLDDKGRVIIPAKCRDPIKGGFFLTRGLDGCLWLFPLARWKTIKANLQALPEEHLTYREFRALERRLFPGSEGSLDRQGRLLISSPMREYAGLSAGGPVIVVGANNRLELWNPDRWRDEMAVLDDTESEIAQQLADQLRDLVL